MAAKKKPTDGDRPAASAPKPAGKGARRRRQPRADGPGEEGCPPFPVVAIGASAGGLEAYKRFFGGMPRDAGMAFVLLQHLDPSHKSMMAELLGRVTEMPVCEIEDQMAIEADHVYVIPPHKHVAIGGGRLKLHEPVVPGAGSYPIDFFFRSLSEACDERAVAIVLSGTGSDGALGLQEVKGRGGMTMAEEPGSATHGGMPRAAVATGMVDFVMPVEEMPDCLLRYRDHPYVAGGGRSGLVAPTKSDGFKSVMTILREGTNTDFSIYKEGTLSRRIERRLGLNHTLRLDHYIELLRGDEQEVRRLFHDLLITVTSFFRNPAAWEALESEVVPELVDRSVRTGLPARVWVAGCATGEEAYSVAMLLSEGFAARDSRFHAQVFATDLDEAAVERARVGRFPKSIVADVPAGRLERFFIEAGDYYAVKKEMRECVVFAQQNLVGEPPFSKIDLVTCRNLLIYLNAEAQNDLARLFHFALNPGGFLFLGSAESLSKHENLFEPVSKPARLFRKRDIATPEHPTFLLRRRVGARPRRPGLETPKRAAASLAELAGDELLRRFAPAAVVIDRNYNALYYHGPVREYLDPPAGEPSLNLTAICLEGLKDKLRTVVHRSLTSGELAEAVARGVGRGGATIDVRITAAPIATASLPGPTLLVTFEDVGGPVSGPRAAPLDDSDEGDDATISQLHAELGSTRKDLQSTIEELESSNEELRASNEEVMSMNEELQSTSEEMETGREELETLNEELSTVNAELGEKIHELEALNDDLSNLLMSADIATIFLDTDLKIRRFTPAARRLINLIPTDVGRPLADLASAMAGDKLIDDVKEVCDQLGVVGREVGARDGRTYLRRILPYRTADRRVEGVVITYGDVTELRAQRDHLAERERQQAVVASLGQKALSGMSLEPLLELATREVARVMDVPLTKVLELLPDGKHLALRAGVGWAEGLVGKGTVSAGRSSQAGYTLDSSAPVIVGNLAEEERFSGPSLLFDHGVVSGMSVIIGDRDKAWGVFGAHTREPRDFSIDDVNFLQAVANTLSQAIQRRALEDHHRRVIDSITDAFLLFDRDWRFVFVNDAAVERLGRARDELTGRVVWDAFPEFADGPFQSALEGAMKRRRRTAIEDYFPPHERWYEVRAYPAEGGGVSCFFTDTTEKRVAKERLYLALQAGRIGVWDGDVETGEFTVDARICELLGFPPGTTTCKLEDFRSRVHPEDSERAAAHYRALLEDGTAEEIAFRVVLPTGEIRWVARRGMVARRASGRAARVVGLNWDVTAQKEAEHESLRARAELERRVDERTEELRVITDNVPAFFAFVDAGLRYRFANRMYAESFRLPVEELLGKRADEVIAYETYQEIQPRLRAALEGEEQNFEVSLEMPNGVTRVVRARYVPRVEKDGSVSGVFILADDITAESQLREEVVSAAEREKARIGRDLHDSVCQELSAIGMFGKALHEALRRRDASEAGEAGDLVAQINLVTQKTRKLARGLSPVVVDNRTLAQALGDLAENVAELFDGIDCLLDDRSGDIEVDEAVATQLYFIAREATFNAARHAKTTRIDLVLDANSSFLSLSVTDNGGGTRAGVEEGLGIRSMRYRARTLGGTLGVRDNRNKNGIEVRCRIGLR